MANVYDELIAAIKNQGLHSFDANTIADTLNDLHEDVADQYSFTEYLILIKKAIQQTLINCKISA